MALHGAWFAFRLSSARRLVRSFGRHSGPSPRSQPPKKKRRRKPRHRRSLRGEVEHLRQSWLRRLSKQSILAALSSAKRRNEFVDQFFDLRPLVQEGFRELNLSRPTPCEPVVQATAERVRLHLHEVMRKELPHLPLRPKWNTILLEQGTMPTRHGNHKGPKGQKHKQAHKAHTAPTKVRRPQAVQLPANGPGIRSMPEFG